MSGEEYEENLRREREEIERWQFAARQFKFEIAPGRLFGGKSGICRVHEWHDDGVCIVTESIAKSEPVYFGFDEITLEEIE